MNQKSEGGTLVEMSQKTEGGALVNKSHKRAESEGRGHTVEGESEE